MNFFADPRWGEALAHLPDYLGNHVRVSLAALALGLVVSLPLAVVARNRPVMRAVLLSLASVVQTVPGLALLALFYPLLLLAASVTLKWFGVSFSAFGFLPAMLASASRIARGAGRLRVRIASGRLMMRPSASAARLTRTWLPR